MSYGSAQSLGALYQHNRVLFWLCVVIFVNQLGFGSVIPVVPLYARSFGVSQSAIGLTVAVYGFARFLISVPAGRLADRIGRRWTLVLGETLTAVGNLLCGLSGSYEQFLAFRFLSGAGASLVVTSGQVILADLSTRSNRGRTIGIYQGVFLFANGFGSLPGGLLAEHVGLSVPFFAFAALGALAAAVAFDKVPDTRWLRERREATAGAPSSPVGSLATQLRAVFGQPGFVLVSLVTFAQTFARTGAIFTVVPLLGALKMGLSPDQIGLGLTVVALADLVMVYFSGVLADRFGRKPVIVPAMLLGALSLASFAIAPGYAWFAASLALWGLAMGLNGPAPAAYAADLAPPGMNAATMSSFRMTADLGYVVGPLLLGWLSDVASREAALFATAGLFVVSSILFAAFAPETAGTGGRRTLSARPAGRAH